MPVRINLKFKGAPLSRAIRLVLALKAGLLLVLWQVFFSRSPLPTSGEAAAALLDSTDFSPIAERRIKP